jgi:hypothetical protein
MSRSLLLAGALAAVLVAAPSAAGKGILEATACGKSECREVDQRTVTPFMAYGGDYTEPPASAAPWYRVTIVVGDELATKPEQRVQDRFTVTVVPDRLLMRGELGDWMPMTRADAAEYKSALEGVEPFPASSMPDAPKAASAAGGSGGSDGGPPVWLIAAAAALLLALTGFALRRRVAASGT